MDNSLILKNAFANWDEKKLFYLKFFSRVKDQQFTISNTDLKSSVIYFYDKNKNKIGEADFEGMGNFYSKYNLFMWDWGNPTLPKNYLYTCKKFLNYGLDITSNDNLHTYVKKLLINPRIQISSTLDLDIIFSLALYLSKADYIFQIDFPEYNEIYYMFIYNIKIF